VPVIIGRRELFATLGGAAVWPFAARGQQPALPIIGILVAAPALVEEKRMVSFRRGLSENGYIEGRNVIFEYFHANNQYERMPVLAADLVRRQVNVIVTPNSESSAMAAKAATRTIPIIFSVTEDPIKIGLVESLARPDGNVTGVYFFSSELGPKRLGLLREIVPSATRFAVLVNPNNPISMLGLRQIQVAARTSGLELLVCNATDIHQIDLAFEDLARERPDGVMLVNDPLFTSHRTQLIALAARYSLPAVYTTRDYPEVGGLMSYAASMAEVYAQLGRYTGQVLQGAKPTALPVVQSTKFELVINVQTAKSLGLEVSPSLLARADEVIE
jgi:putative tryptophan/tyrosine transport system substrate-binding protein